MGSSAPSPLSPDALYSASSTMTGWGGLLGRSGVIMETIPATISGLTRKTRSIWRSLILLGKFSSETGQTPEL